MLRRIFQGLCVWQGRSQGGSWGAREPPFCEPCLTKQPTRGGEYWWVPSLWHSVTPPLKNPGYAPGVWFLNGFSVVTSFCTFVVSIKPLLAVSCYCFECLIVSLGNKLRELFLFLFIVLRVFFWWVLYPLRCVPWTLKVGPARKLMHGTPILN